MLRTEAAQSLVSGTPDGTDEVRVVAQPKQPFEDKLAPVLEKLPLGSQ